VLQRASGRADGSEDATMRERCAACHDPQAPDEGPITRSRPAERVPRATMGIGCESCHGGAKDWIAVHYERDVSRERLKELGMVDTKDLLLRARQCAACHVGSAKQDVNHDMIAAGHPPLRFELASYEALLPRKHWDDRPRRLAEPDYEVRLWAAGRVAAAEGAVELLEGRAERAAGDRRQEAGLDVVWPEFAEGNCFACHQALRRDAGPLPPSTLFKNAVGVPAWRMWNVALVSAAVGPSGFVAAVAELRAGMERSLRPDAAEIAGLAAEARRRLNEARAFADQVDAETVLARLQMMPRNDSWDEACQEVAAVVAVERSLRDRGAIDEDEGAIRRLRSLAAELRFESNRSEWPRVFGEARGTSLPDVARELAAICEELAKAAAKERPR
jgi:Cytochrome c554 and c-prime